jgi:mannose-1-phosphate guanylyltransferase
VTGRFYAIVPAGGSGTRLWPLSRAARPKFLLPLPGPRSMIQETVHRLAQLADERDIFIITGASHGGAVQQQLPNLTAEQFVVEPLPRGSGPAIGLGTAIIARRDPDAIVGSFAADHVVERPERFVDAVRAAIKTAEDGYLVTIGIEPTYPETGFGYIRCGSPLGARAGSPVLRVDEFKEKPDLETATRYVSSGHYLWNASMFVWQARALLDEMRRLLPELAEALECIAADWDTPRRDATLAAIWPTVQDVTIDHGILEHADRVAVVPADLGWTDLGDWHGYGNVASDGSAPNLAQGAELLARDASGAVVIGNGRLIALVGIDNVIIVDTEDALLICERSRAQEVKAVVEELKRRGSTHLL